MSATMSRRRFLPVVVGAPALLVAACATSGGQASPSPSSSAAASQQQRRIAAIARAAMDQYRLRALIVRVTGGGGVPYTGSLGESMTGVPATVGMHVRNGFVAYMYLTTILLQLVDRKQIRLDDRLSRYRPDLPRAESITIRMLAYSTSGYADYVYQPAISDGVDLDPFRQWGTEELIGIGTSAAAQFAPGTNWAYSHTNYAILGTVLAKAAGKSLGELMREHIFQPMGLRQTMSFSTPQIPDPVLHTFSSERRAALDIPSGTPFYEDSTFWNPSWTAATGAVQTSDITDLATSVEMIGSGRLLSPASHQAQVGPALVGFGHPADGCTACRTLTAQKSFGMGVIRQGAWITGNKFYAGSGAIVGYLPAGRVAIAAVTTYQASAFDASGSVTDAGPAILATLARAVAPDSPIPA